MTLQSKPFTKRRIQHEVVPLLEFAWASGLLPWTPDQYAEALLTMFPKEYDDDPIIELAKHAHQMNDQRRKIMQIGIGIRKRDNKKPRRT